MKKFIFAFVIAVTITIQLSAQVSPAQTSPSAKVGTGWVITLPPESRLQNTYTLDMGEMKFNDVDAMEKYFSIYDDDIVSYKVNRLNNTVMLEFDPEYIASHSWTIDMANAYLEKEAADMQKAYDKMYPEK